MINQERWIRIVTQTIYHRKLENVVAYGKKIEVMILLIHDDESEIQY